MSGPNGGNELQTITIGGRKIVKTSDLVILSCAPSGASDRGTFRKNNESAGYVVPASSQFRVVAVRVINRTAADGPLLTLAYSDNDVGISASTAFTNPVYHYGAAGAYTALCENGTGKKCEVETNFVVPTGKYIGVDKQNTSSSCIVQIFGYEEAV